MKREKTKSKDPDQDRPMPRKRSLMPPPGYMIDTGKKHRIEEPIDYEELLDDREEDPPIGEKPHVMQITVGQIETTASLNTSETAVQLWLKLPLKGYAKLWGEEDLYFEIPMTCPPENAQTEVEPGTIAYWPEGDCFCIFFGTHPFGPVNVLGRVDCDPNLFRDVTEGQEVHLARGE